MPIVPIVKLPPPEVETACLAVRRAASYCGAMVTVKPPELPAASTV